MSDVNTNDRYCLVDATGHDRLISGENGIAALLLEENDWTGWRVRRLSDGVGMDVLALNQLELIYNRRISPL